MNQPNLASALSPAAQAAPTTLVRVGVGGWNFEPWRGGNFYPPGLPQAKELAWASRRLSAIEVNGTFYGALPPASFKRWAKETPEDFMFTLKGPRAAVQRADLREAAPAVQRFVFGGLEELGPKLGPLLWQLAPFKRYEPAEMRAFLEALPRQLNGLPLRHALETRHASFQQPGWLALLREHGVASVFADEAGRPTFADLAADFVYARVMRVDAALAEGLQPSQLQALAACARRWQSGGEPLGLPRLEPAGLERAQGRDVFLFFIRVGKERAPAAAMGLRRALADALPADTQP